MWQCYHRFDQSFPNPNCISPNPPPPLALFHAPKAYLVAPTTIFDESWYPNSGASHHLIYDAKNMLTGLDYEGYEQVHVGNGAATPIAHIGSFSLSSNLSNVSFKLNTLMHIPTLTKNLISVSKFAQDINVFFEFHLNTCFVKS